MMDNFVKKNKGGQIFSIKRINLKKLFTLGIIILIASTFLIFIPKVESQKRFSGSGKGTPDDPYVITNVKQLWEIRYNLSAHYVLGNNIDASETRYWKDGEGFEPIGNKDNPFTGSFDGRGYKIYNLYINTARDYVGLFGVVGSGGIIKKVGLENVTISSTSSIRGGAGGLIGRNFGTVSNCYVTGSVRYGYYDAGGLIGDNFGTVSNCYSTASVNGQFQVGGLIGWNAGTVSNSFWDIQTSGLTRSAGGTGKTTEQMKNVRTYTDVAWSKGLDSPWDFVGNPYDDKGNEDIWDINPNINNGYPYLTASISTSPSATTSPATSPTASPTTGTQTITRTITSTITTTITSIFPTTTTITQTIPTTTTTTTIVKEVSYTPKTIVVTERPWFSEETIALGIAILMILASTVIGIWLRRRIVS
jgi:hypothetical protein